jgi:spore germination protein GerM
MRKLIITLFFLLLVIFLASSCNSKSTPPKKTGSEKSLSPNKKTNSQPPNPEVAKQNNETTATTDENTSTISLTIYFSNEQADKLIPEVHKINKTVALAKAALKELLKGPQSANHYPTMPTNTKLLSVSIDKAGLAKVNFSQEFVKNHPGGSASERMTVYSVVNTLTEFSTVKAVKFFVEGQPIVSIAGHMDLAQPIKRDQSLISNSD